MRRILLVQGEITPRLRYSILYSLKEISPHYNSYKTQKRLKNTKKSCATKGLNTFSCVKKYIREVKQSPLDDDTERKLPP